MKKLELLSISILMVLFLNGCGNSHCVRYEDRTGPVWVCQRMNAQGACEIHGTEYRTQSVCVERVCDSGYVRGSGGSCVEAASRPLKSYKPYDVKPVVTTVPESMKPAVIMEPESLVTTVNTGIKPDKSAVTEKVEPIYEPIPVYRSHVDETYGDWTVYTVYDDGFYAIARTVHTSKPLLIVNCREYIPLCSVYYSDQNRCDVGKTYPVIISMSGVNKSNTKATCVQLGELTALNLPENYIDVFTKGDEISIAYLMPGEGKQKMRSTTFSLQGSTKAINKAKESMGLSLK